MRDVECGERWRPLRAQSCPCGLNQTDLRNKRKSREQGPGGPSQCTRLILWLGQPQTHSKHYPTLRLHLFTFDSPRLRSVWRNIACHPTPILRGVEPFARSWLRGGGPERNQPVHSAGSAGSREWCGGEPQGRRGIVSGNGTVPRSRSKGRSPRAVVAASEEEDEVAEAVLVPLRWGRLQLEDVLLHTRPGFATKKS